METWKNIADYETEYQISNMGRVKSLTRFIKSNHNNYRQINGKVMSLAKNKNGYLMVGLMKKRIYKRYGVHRLVALRFIPNPDNKPQVNHKDGNKLNNHVNNLEWVTDKENKIHALKNGLMNDNYTHPKKCKEKNGL